MRILVRVAVVLALLIVAGVVALAVALPRIVKSDAVRARIETAAQQALGREVRWSELDFGLLPPSLLIVEPSVAGAAGQDQPLARAEQVALRVALLPLLARSVVVDSLVVEGASVRLVRTSKGIELPRPAPSAVPAPEESGEAGSSVALAVRSLALRDTTLVLEDRAVSPAVTWELRELDLEARGESLDAPIAFEASGSLASGGKLRASGTASLDGTLAAELVLEALALAPVRPYLPGGAELAGTLAGSIRAVGPASDLEEVSAQLELRDARVALQDVALGGKVGLKADLTGGLARPSGRFEVDASDAELRYGETFRKPAGRTATLAGRLVSRADGSLGGVEEALVQVHNLKADASVKLGKRTEVTADVAPFDVAGWDELVPALAEYQASGQLRLGQVKLATAPLEVHASVPLDGLRAQHPDAGPVTLRGTLIANGQAIDTRDVVLVAADQSIAVDLQVRELGGTPRYRLRTETRKSDTNALVSAFTERRDTFYGLLDFDGDLAGSLGDAPLRSLRGTTRLDIRDGRIVGLSLLRAVLSGLGEAGRSAQGLASLAVNYGALAAPELQRFQREDFQALTGTFRFADGTASTDDLRLDYRDYAAQLDGSFGLESSDYDLGCTITLGPALAELLAAKLGGRPESLERITIPARLSGQLADPFQIGSNPRVVVPPAAAVAFFQAVYLDRHRSTAERAIDDALGQGSGGQVLDVLDGILGGRKPQQ